MTLPLKRDSRFHQGVYEPKNKDKFLGSSCIFRSGLELKFFRFCDGNPNIIKWGSECIVVPYLSKIDNKMHKYYVDNFVHIREGNTIKKYLVEIKPHKQTKPPTITKNKKTASMLYENTQWIINNEGKWPAAREFAKKHGMEFIIITEKELT